MFEQSFFLHLAFLMREARDTSAGRSYRYRAAFTYAESSVTTDNMEVSGDNFLGAQAMICMFHERMFHKCISQASPRETDSYLRPIYLVTVPMA